jgi:DNA-binding GntR family transcriptional regulator
VNSQVSYLVIMIDPDLPVAPYLQLAAILRGQIASGEITGRLPGEKRLVQEYGLAQGTVRRALDVLRGEGLIVTVQGLGSFTRPQSGPPRGP